ncbi:CsbD family protein [Consotaella salsifontis]|uniref:CsbD-like n=1 Tax=Consotaella salsifontis TaxID=1365950 RepID=A0A1T4PZT3_9HYPH|nr:CsbD family protein [Consotaella salsifontis]SJZ96807.1 CsbD-like [Consotaella salsifontis]
MDKDEVKGAAKEMGGKVKKAAGDLTDNDRMKAEGEMDRVEGKTQKNVGKVKDAVKDALD